MAADNRTDWPRVVLIVVAAVVALPLVMMLVALPMMGMMGLWWGTGTMGVRPIWGAAMAAIWLLVLLGGGFLVVRWLGSQRAERRDPALGELRRAYARGDLTDDEFERRREALTADEE